MNRTPGRKRYRRLEVGGSRERRTDRHAARAGLRLRDDRGATLIEAAFATPIFVLLICAALEFSVAMMSYQGVTNSVQAGGREVSVQGNLADADQLTVQRIAVEASGVPGGEIKQIIIWKATSTSDKVPAACTAASSLGDAPAGVNGLCNVYNNPETPTTGAFDRAEDPVNWKNYFGATGGDGLDGQRFDQFYPPTSRSVTVGIPGSGSTKTPDLVGVYIKATHKYYTGLFGSGITITDQRVVSLEPQVYSST